MSRDLAKELYLSYRSRLRKNKNAKDEVLRNRIDDQTAIADVINELIGQKEWQQGIAEGNLFTDWDSLVGPEIASHATPLTLVDGRLTIQTTSTAWATQLNLISHQLLQTITTQAAGALVEELKIIGPHAPSWKKGVRTIRGAKGPRDTYN